MSDYSINIADKTKYVVGVEDIKQSISIILATIPGSIPLQPEFGSNLYQYIDQPINKSFSAIANTIIKDVERWERRVKIKKVSRVVDGSNIKILIYGIYTITQTPVVADIIIVETPTGGIGSMEIGTTFIIQ